MLCYIAVPIPTHTTLWTPQGAVVDAFCGWLSCLVLSGQHELLSSIRLSLPQSDSSAPWCLTEVSPWVSGVPVGRSFRDMRWGGFLRVAGKGLCPDNQVLQSELLEGIMFVPANQRRGTRRAFSFSCLRLFKPSLFWGQREFISKPQWQMSDPWPLL